MQSHVIICELLGTRGHNQNRITDYTLEFYAKKLFLANSHRFSLKTHNNSF